MYMCIYILRYKFQDLLQMQGCSDEQERRLCCPYGSSILVEKKTSNQRAAMKERFLKLISK